MKANKSYLKLFFFSRVAKNYVEANKETENKLVAAINGFSKKQLKDHIENYYDEMDTLQLNNCAIDKDTKVILKDEKGNRQYTVEGELKLKREAKLLMAREVEIHQRIPEGIEDLISKLSDVEKDAFSGIVIPEQPNE